MHYLALREQEAGSFWDKLEDLKDGYADVLTDADLPENDYHSIKDFYSWHDFDPISDSPLECRYKLDAKPETKPEWIEGRAIHQLLIFGHLEGWGIRGKDIDGRTKRGKEVLAQLEAKFGENICSESVLEIDSIYEEHSFVKQIRAATTHREHSFFWRDGELGGLLRRARTDVYCRPLALLNDIKTTWTFDKDSLRKSLKNYIRQQANYREALQVAGLPVEHCTITWVKKTPPYDVAVWRIPDAELDAAHEQNRANLKLFKSCLDSGIWPGRYPFIEEIGAL